MRPIVPSLFLAALLSASVAAHASELRIALADDFVYTDGNLHGYPGPIQISNALDRSVVFTVPSIPSAIESLGAKRSRIKGELVRFRVRLMQPGGSDESCVGEIMNVSVETFAIGCVRPDTVPATCTMKSVHKTKAKRTCERSETAD